MTLRFSWFDLESVDGRYVSPLRLRPGIFGDLEARYSRRNTELGEKFFDLHLPLLEKLAARGFEDREKIEFVESQARYSCWSKVGHMRFWDEPDSPQPKPVPITNMDAFVRVHCAYARIKLFRKKSPRYSAVDKKLKSIVEEVDELAIEAAEGNSKGKLIYVKGSVHSASPRIGKFSKKFEEWLVHPDKCIAETTRTSELNAPLVQAVLSETEGCLAYSALVGFLASALPDHAIIEVDLINDEGQERELTDLRITPAQRLEFVEEYSETKMGYRRLNVHELRVLYLSVPQGHPASPLEMAITADVETIDSLAELLEVEAGDIDSWLFEIISCRKAKGVEGLNAGFVGKVLDITPGLVTSRLKEARKKLREEATSQMKQGEVYDR